MTEQELEAIEARQAKKGRPGGFIGVCRHIDGSTGETVTGCRIDDGSDEAATGLAHDIRHLFADRKTLLAEVRLLQGILRDMQTDSIAYRAGLEEGRRLGFAEAEDLYGIGDTRSSRPRDWTEEDAEAAATEATP